MFDTIFNQIVDEILFEQIGKLWDLELDVKVRFRSIERFQSFDYFAAMSCRRTPSIRWDKTVHCLGEFGA